MIYDEDHVGSDDMEEILEYTRRDFEASRSGPSYASASGSAGPSASRAGGAGPSTSRRGSAQQSISNRTSRPHPTTTTSSTAASTTTAHNNQQPTYALRQEINAKISTLESEIRDAESDIAKLQDMVTVKRDEVAKLEQRLLLATTTMTNGAGKGTLKTGIDYSTGIFDWSDYLKVQMKAVFGIEEFRLCQRGVCNANMDGRDIVCVMPTGAGKSLTYQLPSLITAGITLVISPLLALMSDQVYHMLEHGVEAAKLSSATSKAEKEEIYRRLSMLASSSNSTGTSNNAHRKELKLLYVTPERIAKDNKFTAKLQAIDKCGNLARLVIDEAHCVSALGHDYRPDYQKLDRLRKLFPKVPIMALSATCPPAVLDDLIKTLGLDVVVDGNMIVADDVDLVQTQAPKEPSTSLHLSIAGTYIIQIVPKPAKAVDSVKVMMEYIMEKHEGETGIIYCLSRKDTETVAEKLRELSGGKIKTGWYHADVPDKEKEALHLKWRDGIVKVVCATIAFGMGIDKKDVRFVLHHSMSKSLEGYYQESGRAGRDGNDSDCVLYYRPQDASTLSGMIALDKSGREKLHSMLSFAEDIEECRKIQFARYFSLSSNLSIASWSTDDESALQRCGHCDNCLRAPDSIESKDVTLATWQILKIVSAVRQSGGNLTLNMLAGLARGAGGAAYEVGVGKGKGKTKEKVNLDLYALAGGPVDLSKDDMEHLLVRLLTNDYLKEEYKTGGYQVLVYVTHGRLAPSLIHQTREDVLKSGRSKIVFSFLASGKKKRPTQDPSQSSTTIPTKRKSTGGKGKARAAETEFLRARAAATDFVSTDEEVEDDDEAEDQVEIVPDARLKRPTVRSSYVPVPLIEDIENASDADDAELYEWSHTLLNEPPTKRPRNRENGDDTKMTIVREGDNEVLVLSDSD